MSSDSIFRLFVFAVLFLLLVALRRRRESIRHAIRRGFFAGATYVGVVYVLAQRGRTAVESFLGGVLAGLIVSWMIPARSRYVPASIRRKKIREYELETGKKYNTRKLELDHEIPFSKGGSHNEDNLRVVERKRNHSKGGQAGTRGHLLQGRRHPATS